MKRNLDQPPQDEPQAKRLHVDDNCSICSEPLPSEIFSPAEPNGILTLDCHHSFHGECLKDWATSQAITGQKIDVWADTNTLERVTYKRVAPSCPICRTVFTAGSYWPDLTQADSLYQEEETYQGPNPDYDPTLSVQDESSSEEGATFSSDEEPFRETYEIHAAEDLTLALESQSPNIALFVTLDPQYQEQICHALGIGSLTEVSVKNDASFTVNFDPSNGGTVYIDSGGKATEIYAGDVSVQAGGEATNIYGGKVSVSAEGEATNIYGGKVYLSPGATATNIHGGEVYLSPGLRPIELTDGVTYGYIDNQWIQR